ncbi:L-threonylcarbamoyladenylate synthase [Thiomicrorhabdus aquaedulcis]|uniref:L-threonylcarbamoyladenylate synthase n=1 Tax=Thiomicrorhabdus aquaedulcis TaxID=2211106 RepID=UPI0018D54A54|nr:L-threonylcarbamoyladenylate synthase [Thiomicrorhabdus aquaedulcis]
MTHLTLSQTVSQINAGDVVAYPTESVFGLGCDPFNEAAVQKLFHVKQREHTKGLILIAATVEQIAPYVLLHNQAWQQAVLATWPGPVTWILPTKTHLPNWITGGRDTVAVRVSSHPTVQALCLACGHALISTSANPSGQPPAKSCAQVEAYFQNQINCLDGALGNLSKPTQIIDAQTGHILR